MAVIASARAFVVDVRDYRETSALVRLLVEGEGLVTLLGRGLRGPRKGGASHPLQPLALVQVNYSMRDPDGLGALRSAELEQHFSVLRTSIEAYGLAGAWFEVMLAAAQPGEEGASLFVLTEGYMQRLQATDGVLGPQLLWYWARLLAALGVGAQVGECGVCGRREQLHHFDLRHAATLCSACARGQHRYLPLTEGDVRLLAPVFAQREPTAPAAVLPSRLTRLFFRIVREILRRHLELELKSFEFLAKVLR